MEAEDWVKAKAIFDAAIEVASDQRKAFLDNACAGDKELRREIEALLASAEAAGSFMEMPFAGQIGNLLIGSKRDQLKPGQDFNRYKIIHKIGEGGMGEVYLAQDSLLKRRVAIKLLSNDVTRDPDQLRRFVREARVASALNHPNIITIYEIGQDGDVHFITTEFVVGETLRHHLAREPFKIAGAVDIAIDIASALVVAHDANIVHRDIKPENIMLREDGILKVLDFGLAKLSEDKDRIRDLAHDSWHSVKTTPGFVLGTVGYMSPEQARGDSLDARTDIWSLGVVLYEMIVGRPPFGGATPVDVMAAILKDEPRSIYLTLPNIPDRLQRIIATALSKSPDERYQTMRDVLIELKDFRRDLEFQTNFERPARDFGRGGTWARTSGRGGAARQTEIIDAPLLPKLSQITFSEAIEQDPAWSPNGEDIAFSREETGHRSIFVKSIGRGEERRLTGGDHDDIQPAWSPDGRTILFVRSRQPNVKLEPGDVFGLFYEGDIWSVDIATRKETKLVENAFNPDFSPDGKRIAFDASWAGPRRLWAVDSLGHNPQQLTSDTSEGISHVRPRWSPDGRRIAFQNIERTKFDVRVFDLTNGKSVWVTRDAVQDLNPVWSPSGKFIYFSSLRGGGINVWRCAMSSDGTPASAPQQLTNGAGQDVQIAISRDGKRLAFSILRQNADLWRLPVSPETGRPSGSPEEVIKTTREDSRGSWSPDGKMIAFNSDRTGEMNIWLHSFEDGQSRQLTKGAGGDFQANWSTDSKRIVFFSSRAGTADIWGVDVESGELERLTSTNFVEVNPCFSPDGKMIAYSSDQTGRPEVWVMRSDGSEARQLTDAGLGVMGHFQRWTQNGDAVIFRSPGSAVTVKVYLDGRAPEILPEVAGGAHMSFSPDYSRIMDVVGHKALWVSPLHGGKPEKVFEFEDPDIRIDYPVWSPDGRWVLFDRSRPQGGDVWMMENFEYQLAQEVLLDSKSPHLQIETERRSIAILPFTNITGDASEKFYEFALADGVITELARSRSLTVRPSSAVAKYLGKENDPLAIGRELKVDAILAANFLISKKRIRVTTQLIDVENENVIWSELIDSSADDIMGLQDTITHRIVDGLKCKLETSSETEISVPVTSNSLAYMEYLRGRDQLRRYVFHTAATENVEIAINHFQRAIDIDSGFALAHCALGTSYLQRVLKVVGGREDVENAAAALDRALALDPKLIEARAYRAAITRLQGEAQKSRELMSQLRRDAPDNFEVQYLSAAFFRFDGDYQNVFRCYSEMLRIDPTAKVSVHCFRARIFWYQGRFDESLRELGQAEQIEPNHFFVKVFHAILKFHSGDPAGAAASFRQMFRAYPGSGFRPYLSMCLSALGEREAALDELTVETERVADVDPDVSYWLASAYLMAGEPDLALKWLRRSIEVGNHNLPWFESNPVWKPMADDRRFKELMSGLRSGEFDRIV